MKQKSYKWVLYIILLALIGGLVYFATQDITPISEQVEKSIEVHIG